MGHRTIFYYDSRSNLTCVRDDDLGQVAFGAPAGPARGYPPDCVTPDPASLALF